MSAAALAVIEHTRVSPPPSPIPNAASSPPPKKRLFAGIWARVAQPRFRTALNTYTVGVVRLLKILIGWQAESSQEVATHLLMFIGFIIEGTVLFRAITVTANSDFAGVRGISTAVPLLVYLFALVILLLLFHQFLIFRNFSLPRELARQADRKLTASKVEQALMEMRGPDPASGILTLETLRPLVETPESISHQPPRKQRYIETTVFLLFGVLTGEAGYSLAVIHEHNPANVTIQLMQTLFGTSPREWGLTLECAFLLCATVICLLVYAWDWVVRLSPRAMATYGLPAIRRFLTIDLLSAVFWLCLFLLVTPRARLWLGARYSPLLDLGYCAFAWVVLLLCSVTYVVILWRRFIAGLSAVARAPNYSDARLTTL